MKWRLSARDSALQGRSEEVCAHGTGCEREEPYSRTVREGISASSHCTTVPFWKHTKMWTVFSKNLKLSSYRPYVKNLPPVLFEDPLVSLYTLLSHSPVFLSLASSYSFSAFSSPHSPFSISLFPGPYLFRPCRFSLPMLPPFLRHLPPFLILPSSLRLSPLLSSLSFTSSRSPCDGSVSPNSACLHFERVWFCKQCMCIGASQDAPRPSQTHAC